MAIAQARCLSLQMEMEDSFVRFRALPKSSAGMAITRVVAARSRLLAARLTAGDISCRYIT